MNDQDDIAAHTPSLAPAALLIRLSIPAIAIRPSACEGRVFDQISLVILIWSEAPHRYLYAHPMSTRTVIPRRSVINKLVLETKRL